MDNARALEVVQSVDLVSDALDGIHADLLAEWAALREERKQARRHATATEILAAWTGRKDMDDCGDADLAADAVRRADSLLAELERTAR